MHPPPDRATVRRARTLFVLALGAFVATAAWLVFGHHLGDLQALGIPTMDPRFADARTISGASVALAQGLDPLVSNPGDPWGRAMNYPRIWLAFAHLGLGPADTRYLALAFLLAFGSGLLLLLPMARTASIAIVLATALFSPAVWLAVERANNDLLLFGLVAAAAWLVAHRPRLASTCIGAAAVLKLFPIFALTGLATSTARGTLRLALPVAVAFGAYVGLIHGDLALIQVHTVHWNRIAYGIDQLPNALAAQTGWSLVPLLVAAAAALLLAFTVSFAARLRARLGAATTTHSLPAFRIGAAIYVGSFCLGSNFDYRLIFLLLTIPQLATWVATTRSVARASAVTLLGVLVLLMWGMTWRLWLYRAVGAEAPGLMLDEALSWALAIGMLAALVLSMPDWMLPAGRRGTAFLDAARSGAGLPLPIEQPPHPHRETASHEASG
ncbi:MAG: glycosyltransferase 87 family protein [Planctomycetota bacterium]